MKRKHWITGPVMFMIVLCLLLGLVACKDSVRTPILGHKPRVLKEGEIPIKVTIDDKNFPSYRTMYPSDWDNTKKSTLKFKLTGKTADAVATPIAERSYEWSALKAEGTASVVLDEGSYKLIMTAYDASNKVVLKSDETTAEIGSVSYIDFVMKPYRDTQAHATDSNTAKGSVEIKVKYHNPKEYITTANATLTPYDYDGTGAIGSALDNAGLGGGAATNEGTEENIVTKRTYTSTSVVPGVYMFKVELSSDIGLVSTISDIVVVDSGNTTRGAITCPVDLRTPPMAPANFKVEYIRPADADTNYKVKFTWEDKSVNEDKFVIDIINDAGTSIFGGTAKEVASNTEEYTLEDANKLDLTKKYTAKITAKNNYGDSDIVRYINPRSGDFIHLARITYDLKGGTFIAHPDNSLLGAEETGGAVPKKIIAYYTSAKTGYEFGLMNDAKLPLIYKVTSGADPKKSMKFKGWYEATAPTSFLQSIPADETKSYTLNAKWEIATDVILTFPSYNDEAYITDSSHCKDYTSNSDEAITVKIASENAITAIDAKWYFDTNSITTVSAPTSPTHGTNMLASTATAAKSATLTFHKEVSAGSIHQVLCVLKYTTTNAAGKTVNRVASAYCYIRGK